MRISILPLAILLYLPSVLSSPAAPGITPAPRAYQPQARADNAASLLSADLIHNSSLTMTILGGGSWPQGGNLAPQCQGDPTKYDDTCQCHEGFVTPKNPLDPCCCGDQKNTLLVIEGCQKHGCNEAVCLCKPHHSWYNIRDKKCVCDRGYIASFKNGKLKCTPPGSSTSSSPPTTGSGGVARGKRAMIDAIQQRKYDETESKASPGALEGFLGCQSNEMACEVDGAWTCRDVMSNLASCGACHGAPGADCGSLPGVDKVRCDTGRCAIDSCLRGFERVPTESAANSGAPVHACKPKKAESAWLKVQVGGDM